jgi:hypothetical protein
MCRARLQLRSGKWRRTRPEWSLLGLGRRTPAPGRARQRVPASGSASRPNGPRAPRPARNQSGRNLRLRDRVRRGFAQAKQPRLSGRSSEHRTTPRPRPVPGPPGAAPLTVRGARPSYVPPSTIPLRRWPCQEPFGGRSQPFVAGDRPVSQRGRQRRGRLLRARRAPPGAAPRASCRTRPIRPATPQRAAACRARA